MKIERIFIRNYKSISPDGIELKFKDGLMTLIGKNNAGKSNIIEAIGILLGTKNPIYSNFTQDCFNVPTEKIIIEAEIVGLNFGNGKQIGLSDVQCRSLIHEGKRVETRAGAITITLTIPPHMGPIDDSEEEVNGKKLELFLANRHEVKQKIDKIRRALIHYLDVPASRNHDAQLSPSAWSHYGRLLRDILKDSEQLEKLRTLISETTQTLKTILSEEAKILSDSAKVTSYVDNVDFCFTKDENPFELLRNLSLAIQYGDRVEDISSAGTGTQSALIIAILELCLKYKSKFGIRFFVVEEPELYLHPHAQRLLASLLVQVAKEENTHIIVTTHSPYILSETAVQNIVRVDRSDSFWTRCLTLSDDYAFIEKAKRILTAENSEMLLADRVVLVEGPSEKILLPCIAKILGKEDKAFSLDRNNISIINMGGNANIETFTYLLESFSIDWRCVLDSDSLMGNTINYFKNKAEILPNDPIETQRTKLKTIGIGVLSDGEIEDYYPHDAIVEIYNSKIEDESQKIKADDVITKLQEQKTIYSEPSTLKIIETLITTYQDEISSSDAQKLPKLVKSWYSGTLESLRKEEGSPPKKTGDSLEKWIKLSKPFIALRIADWLERNPGKIPLKLKALNQWLTENPNKTSMDVPALSVN